ncbi:unnamed protein product [Heligmosomoides polygyrus]|uniref:ATP-dependent DNA helicase n=1 Tax=Heligmosomoides polygyrus TaxID=6339 RepID=A0A183FUC1_HELPZ|nr:unnamed protein product [Heligmosomoides polygyrus]
MILRLVSSAEDPLYRSMVIDFSGRKHDAKTLLKQIFVYYNLEFLKLEGCELTDRDIFNVREIKCKVKYLCLWDNKFTKPWQLLAIRFPLVEHLNMERNKIPVERIGRSHEGNKLEHCTRIDVDEWDYRREKFFRAYCPSLKYVNGVKLEQLTGTQGAAATSGADDEGCTSMRENQMLSVELEEMMGSMMLKYALRTFRYCQECDSYMKSGTEVCRNPNCSLPSRTQCRSAIYTVRIRPQLELILRSVLHHLVVVHSELHLDVRGDRNRCRETTAFAAYKEDIETLEDFVRFEMNVVLTMNFDGEKNKYENNILVGLLISRKPLSQHLLKELFYRMKAALRELGEHPVLVHDKNGQEWKLRPPLSNAVTDFAAQQTLFGCPKWSSEQGCHLCTMKGERIGRLMIWFNRFPDTTERRTRESILVDSSANRNGLAGPTQMVELLTMDRCRPDSLHVLDEGITCDLFRELFTTKGHTPAAFRISKENVVTLCTSLEKLQSFTYASKIMMNIVFFLIEAGGLCPNPVASVAVLSYWILVVTLQMSHKQELNISTGYDAKAPLVRVVTVAVLVKAPCLQRYGTPNHWSSAGFESNHRRMQLRIAQSTPHCEGSLVRGFPKQMQLREHWYIPTQSELDMDSLAQHHKIFFFIAITESAS